VRAQIITSLILIIFAMSTASADDLVKFDSAAYTMGQIQQRQARERGETPANAPDATIEGYLSKPDGSGPFLPLSMCMDAVGSRQIPASAWRSS
jgi:hypothetical protein